MLLQSGGALIVIILLLLGVKKLLKSLSHRGGRGARCLTVKETLVIGPRERLMIAQVGEKQIVIGVTPQSIQLLCTLPEPSAESPTPSPLPPSRFAEKFAQLRARKTR